MPKAIIIHGSYGNPEENWFPWLKTELEKLNYDVYVPKFPSPEGQNLENWKNIFSDYKKYLNKDTILIGHSLAPAFILNILEELEEPIKASFLVSGFLNLLGNETFDKVNKTFIEKEFNWEKIKNNCNDFYVFHGSNDPYVPISEANNLAKKLNVEVEIIENGGHLNEEAGYDKFEVLLEEIKNNI